MEPQQEVAVSCPYCGESFSLLVDCTAGAQELIEDCYVCCRPIEFAVAIDVSGWPQVRARRDDE